MITGEQIKAARKLLGWSAATLAIKSHRSMMVVARAENASLAPERAEKTLMAIQATLEAVGVECTDEGQPGVRLKGKIHGR